MRKSYIILFSLFMFIFMGVFSAKEVHAKSSQVLEHHLVAEITNNAIAPELGTNSKSAESGSIFSKYILVIWKALISVGALAVLFNFVMAAINWITAGGDEGKIKKAREQMSNGIIGMVLLASSYVLIGYVGKLFGLDLLMFSIPGPAKIPDIPAIPSTGGH